MDYQHARGIALGGRLLRDELFGEVIVEVGQLH
jgi:hypothetical protein